MFSSMSLRKKLIILFLLVGIIPMVISLFVGYRSSAKTMSDQSFAQLVSIRESKKSEIENYFTTIENQVITLSESPTTVDAMKAFRPAFHEINKDLHLTKKGLDEYRAGVRKYYMREYQSMLGKKSTSIIDAEGLVPKDMNSIILQYTYMTNNENPLGGKDAMYDASDGSRYSDLHAKYHPAFRSFLQKFGFYDIFLIDTTGQVVYSVFKEVDYATNVKSGPYSSSGLGDAFRQAVIAKEKDSSSLTPFKPYVPSYTAPASFISSPIYDGSQFIGVLVFQMPVDKINEIMTSNERWAEIGLGASGETYLVDQNNKIVNNSRFLIDDHDGYLKALKNAGVSEKILNSIDKLGSSIGLQDVKSESATRALRGQDGVHIINDYRNVPVLSAYTPLNVLGLRWGLLAEIDEEEAFAALSTLKRTTVILLIVIGIIIIVIGTIVSSRISGPIRTLMLTMSRVGQTGNLALRVDVKSEDEIGQMGTAFNAMLSRFHEVVRGIHTTADHLASSSEELSASATQIASGTETQSDKASHVATASQEMNATIVEVAKNVSGVADTARLANEAAVKGSEVVTLTIESMNGIAATARESNADIATLGSRSKDIGNIIKVIDDIADQTNLLALNAAIEAQRAGESGKGFAVVAEEVRKLAERTTNATKEIGIMIKAMQVETGKAISTMDKEVEIVQQGVSLAEEAGAALMEIAGQVDTVSNVIVQIATASEEQSVTADQISGDIESVAIITRETSEGVHQIVQASQNLAELSVSLQTAVAMFKV